MIVFRLIKPEILLMRTAFAYDVQSNIKKFYLYITCSVRLSTTQKKSQLIYFVIQQNFIPFKSSTSKHVLHLITTHNVNTYCVTETSGTKFASIYNFTVIIL